MNKNIYNRRRDRGGVMLLTVFIFLTVGVLVVSGLSFSVTSYIKNLQSLTNSKQSYYTGEANLEDVLYRLKNDITVTTTGNGTRLLLAGQNSTTTATTIDADTKLIKVDSVGADGSQRHITATVTKDWTLSFNYDVQTGDDGYDMTDHAFVKGDIYSNDTITGYGQINGSAIAVNGIMGDSTSRKLMIGTSSNSIVWAPKITNTSSPGTFYCSTSSALSNGSVVKNCDTSRGAPPAITLPAISTSSMTEWQNEALAGGTYQGSLLISSNTSLGPKVINGNLTINSYATLNLTGTVWVKGSLHMYTTGSRIKLDPSFAEKSGVLLADSYIQSTAHGQFTGSGQDGSVLVLISKATCPGGANCVADHGDSFVPNVAINWHNYVSSWNSSLHSVVSLIAPYGQVSINGDSEVTMVYGDSVVIDDTASINPEDYSTGSLIFSGGSTAGWNILTWKESSN